MQQGNIDDMDALVGRSLGQLRIIERIGAGGMATVFKAYQPNLDRYVAIKVLPADRARDPIFIKRFTQEARAVARLVHPHILQIHDFGEQDDITFIVMEYVDGGTLKDCLKRARALPVAEAVDYMIQAAEGLNCAHNHGIIHRDVKPANMLLRKDGYLLLSDFGIAKILEGTTNLTRVGTIGTPQYMSPEQGTGGKVDRRSDIYSLGIVLFHCLIGRVPFSAENPLTITFKHLNDPIPVEWMRMAGVPAPVEQVVLNMTAKAPEDRYQTTDELITALTSALAASHLSMPARWRPGVSSTMPQPGVGAPSGGGGILVQEPMPSLPGQVQVASLYSSQSVVTLSCFRCGASNPSTRLFCTTCGYELSDKGAAADRFMGPNGRPVLARLTIQHGPMGGRSYLFHQDVTTIGRTDGCDLVISGRTVSRRHARLWFNDGHWIIEDLRSANGTRVNGVHVCQPVGLNDGDVIAFGDEIVVFHTMY